MAYSAVAVMITCGVLAVYATANDPQCPFIQMCPELPLGLRCTNDFDSTMTCTIPRDLVFRTPRSAAGQETVMNPEEAIVKATYGTHTSKCVLKRSGSRLSCSMQFNGNRIFDQHQRWTIELVYKHDIVQMRYGAYNPICFIKVDPPSTLSASGSTITIDRWSHRALSSMYVDVEWKGKGSAPSFREIRRCVRDKSCQLKVPASYEAGTVTARARWTPWTPMAVQKYWSDWSETITWSLG